MSTEVGRGKIGRIQTHASPDPEPMRTSPPRDGKFPELVPGTGGPRRVRRALVALLVGGAVLTLLVPITLWVSYNLTHVVSRNAVVKGYITQVGAQLEGVLTSVEVDDGQSVQAGQILARFEDRQLQAYVERARSQLEKASRELEVERLAIEQERRRLAGAVTEASARAAAARAQVDAARSQADDAKVWYEQRKSLAQVGAIAQEELRAAEIRRRTTEALEATASADQKAAEATQRMAEVESEGLAVRRQHLVVLEADVAAFRAELERAEADLKAAVILAPADGWVVRRISEAGSSVARGQPIVSLWIGKEVWVEAWIEEDDIAKVAVGGPVQVTVKPFPKRVFTGVVETVGHSTDFEIPDTAVPQPRKDRMRATPVVCVRVRLDQSDGLFPGLSAVVGIRKKAPG